MIITKRISVLFLIFIAASCESIILNDINSQLDKQQILNRIQGSYTACNPTASPSFWRLDTVTINGSNFTNNITITNDASCANAIYTYVSMSSIDFAEYENKISNIFNLGLKTLNVELTVFNSFQEGRNYCGFTDWSSTVVKNISGLSCPTLLSSDPFHSTIREVGEFEYFQVSKSALDLSISVDFNESGDSLGEIRFSGQVALSD